MSARYPDCRSCTSARAKDIETGQKTDGEDRGLRKLSSFSGFHRYPANQCEALHNLQFVYFRL